MPDYNPWAQPIFPNGAAFGTGSPAETSTQPAGAADLTSSLYNYFGNLAKQAFGASEEMRQGGDYNPKPALEAAMLPMGTGAIAGVPMRAGEAVLGAGPIRAYHGSPHDFDAFDLSKIGTGEGAQAYGHGLYFADSENVAKSYRDALAGGSNANARTAITNAAGDVDKAIADTQERLANYKAMVGGDPSKYDQQRVNNLINIQNQKLEALAAQKAGLEMPKGHMYEVNINADPAHFLDWDKPLSGEAAQKASEALKTAGIDKTLADYIVANKTGKDVYTTLANKKYDTRVMPSDAGAVPASDIMREAGIPGIKYLDQGSRGAGEGSSNYVVFNDKLIDIMRKYGLAGMLGAPVFANSGEQKS